MDLQLSVPPVKITAGAAMTDKPVSWKDFINFVLLAEYEALQVLKESRH